MPESFLDTLARLRQQSEPQPAPTPTQSLPTQYDSVSMPGGRLTDADTYTQGAEKFRVAGVDAPELMDKATHTQLLQPGQEAYANAAALFQNYGSSQRRGVDIHGRTVATPFDTQGRDIAAEEVRQGIAPPVDFNRSGVMPYAKEAAEYFDKTHPPSEAAQAQAEFTGGKLTGKTFVPDPPDPKKRGYLGELGAGLKRGIDQGQAGLYGATSLAGKLLADESRGSDPLTWKSDDPRLTLQDRISNWLQRVGNTGAMRNDEESSRNPAAYSFDDVLKGKGDLLQWMMGAVGEAAPSTGLMLTASLATGGLGAAAESVALRGLAGKALQGTALSAAENAAATALRRKLLASGVLSDVVTPGMLNTVAKEVAANPLKFALRSRAANAGTFLGAWGGSAALEGGHDWTDAQQALGPQADPRYALGAGLAAGLLDTAALHVMMAPVAKMFATPVAEATLATLPGRTAAEKMGGIIGAMAKGGLHGILAEAPTEGLQEVISAASVELQKKSDVPLIDRLMQPDYVKRYIEAAASGMAFGGLFSGASHGISHALQHASAAEQRGHEYKDYLYSGPQVVPNTVSTDSHDPLGSANAVPIGDQLQGRVDVPIRQANISPNGSEIRSFSGVDAGVPSKVASDSVLRGTETPLDPSNTVPLMDQLQGAGQVPGSGRVLGDTGADLRGLELSGDRITANTQLFGDLRTAQAVREQGFGSLDIDRQRAVLDRMRAAIHNDEIARIVVASIPVEMMYHLVGEQGTPDSLLRDKAMLENVFSVSAPSSVATLQGRIIDQVAASTPFNMAVRGTETISTGADPAGRPMESDATIGVGTDASRHSEVPLGQESKGVGASGETGAPGPSIPQTPQRQAALTKAERKGYEQAKEGYAKAVDSNALATEAERLGRIVAQSNVTAPLKAAFNGRIRAIEERLTELSQVAEKPAETAPQTEAPIQLQRGQSVVLRPGERIFNDRNAPPPEPPQERGPLPEQQASVRRQMELAQRRAAESAPTAEATPAPSLSVAPSTTADAGAETTDQRSSAPVLLPASPAPENNLHSSEGTAPAPSPAPVESNQSLESPSPTSALLLQNGKVRLRYEDSTQDKTVSRAEFEKDHAKLFTEALAAKAKEQNSKSNVLIADGSALAKGISPEKILATAPNVAAPSVAETKTSPVTRTDLTPEALQHPDVQQGVNHAKRLTNAWADLLGAEQSEVPITVEQARALSGTDPKAQFQASVKLARDYAKTFVAAKWDNAGDQIKKKVQEVYKKRASKIEFDSWLAREVGDALLNDDYMRRLYADAHQSLAYRWLRDVGAGLAKLAKAVLSQFGLKESSPAIAEFVRSLVDHRRTELAERNGLSIRNSIDMKELTNQLLGGKDTSTQLNLIADRLTEDRAGPLYTRWLSALQTAQRAVEALSTTEPKLREQVQDALRSAVNRAYPFWQTPGAVRRRLMRQRASDVIRALPAVEGASPEAMQAIREIANLASKLEDSLAVAQSFAAATDALLPVEQGRANPRGRALADLMQESEDVRIANRGVTQAFLDALQQEGTQQFEAATRREADPALVERLRAALADREKLATALQMNDVQLAGTGAKALLSAVWKAMGFAAEEVPRIVPAGKVWEHVGVQIDARQDAVAGVIEGASQYAAASRLMERLPAAFRDALARAYQREGEGDPIQWYGQQIALALRSDPALWLTLYQTVPESASDAEAMNRLTTERRTYNHLLRQAVTAEETAVPEVAEALRERLRGRYGREAMDNTERLLGTTGSPLHAWFLLAQGYLPTKDAAPQFTKERSRQVQSVLRDAKMLLDLTPGISEASIAEQAKFLQQNLPALAGFEPDFNHLSPKQNAAKALVEWFNRLNPDQQGEVTPGEAVEDHGDPTAVVEDEEEWMAKALEDGAAMADSDEFYQQKREAEERKTVLENTIALLSDYSPKKGRAAAQLVRRFRVLEQGATESALLNSDQATDFTPGIPLNERFEADLGDANFRSLPTDLQHVLLQRAQVLSRMGIVPEYRLAQHETAAGRSITYAKESLVLNDQATLQAGTMKNGAVASQLALDFAKNLFEESRRFVSRWTHAAKFGSPRDARFGAIEFDVRSALDHPLLSRLVEAIDRDSNIGTELRRLAADYAMIPEPGLLDQATKLLPALRQSLELDSGLHEFMSADPARFAQLLVGAMGFDQEVFHNDYGPELNDPNLRPHERTTQIRNTVLIDPKYAKELGLKPKQGEKGVYYPLTIKGENSLREVLNAFVRMFVASYDPNTNTLKSGAKATISADALVGVGGKTLTGLEASPNSNFDRIHRLYRGFDLASQLASPWVPVDEFWQNWHGLNDKRLENDPHMNLILFRGQDETMTISDALAARKVADILQGDGVENQNFNEKSLSELDEDIQFWQGRMDELKRQHDLSNGQSLTEQARADDGRTLWTYEGVMEPQVLSRALSGDKAAAVKLYNAQMMEWERQQRTNPQGKLPQPKMPKVAEAMRWLSRFRWEGQPKELTFEDRKYTARKFYGLDEVRYAHSRIGGLRARIAELRERLKSEGYINEKRGLSGSQLNYYQNIEEELGRYQAWVDSLGLGNNAARINPEQVLFNPDLNSQEVKWNADLREYQRQRYTDATLRGEAPGQTVGEVQQKDLPEPNKPQPPASKPPSIEALTALPIPPASNEAMNPAPPNFNVERLSTIQQTPQVQFQQQFGDFTRKTATLLDLDPSQYSLDLIDLNRLQALKGSANFAETMRALGYADIADNAWNHVLEEPVFTVFKNGHARIVALSTFTQGEEAFLRNAIAHELGHIYFRTYLEEAVQNTSRRDALRSHLGLRTDATDLQIEEAVAEAIREHVVDKTPMPTSWIGRIFKKLRSTLNLIGGKDNVTLESLLEHVKHRANPSDGVAYYSGRKLLNQSKDLGQGTWETMKDLYSAVVRTSHSWLRAQRNSEGKGIEAFRLMADILRWTAGKAPQSRALGGQLFDFSSTDGSYRISYEQATQRFFARFGHRVETMLNSWNPAKEKASIWNAQQRAEIAETQRQRQVQAVRDYVAGVKSEEAEQLRQYFDTLGNYFGEVLKRYDAGKTLPRIFNQEVLRERKADFVTLLEDTGVETEEAEKIYAKLAQIEGSDYRNDPEVFFAPHFQRARMGDALDRLTDAQLLPFLLIDSQPQAALWQYTHQAVKRTEFERRFGGWVYADQPVDFSPNQPIAPKLLSEADAALMQKAQPIAVNPLTGMPRYELPGGRRVLWDQTAKWRLLRANAAEQGATSSQLNYFLKATEAELGRYGANFSPRLRTMQSALVAGMNWAVLPLSLTSQVTDLALPLLRSNGDFKAAWAGMKKTIAELRTKGDLYAAAKANGILSGNLRSYFASSYLDAPFMDTWAMRWNERLFKYNGMEKATEFTRMFAFATGAEWVKSLAAKDTAEANAQLAQLGLDRADVLAWQAQQEKLDTGEGAPDEASERIQQALNTFVEQSMFRPSASQRPVWASHPAAMLVWYLKSYMWAYTDTVLSRTWREFQRLDGAGQKALMLALPALFMMPLAALGLALRNELRDDLDGLVPWRTPKPQKELDATDELMVLIGRTGLLGPMQTLLDANRASEYGSPYYLSLIGPFATMSDQIFKEVGTAKEGHRSKATADVLMRLMPVMGSLPQERKAILDAAF